MRRKGGATVKKDVSAKQPPKQKEEKRRTDLIPETSKPEPSPLPLPFTPEDPFKRHVKLLLRKDTLILKRNWMFFVMFFLLPFTMMLAFARLQSYVEVQLAPEQHNYKRKCDKNVDRHLYRYYL